MLSTTVGIVQLNSSINFFDNCKSPYAAGFTASLLPIYKGMLRKTVSYDCTKIDTLKFFKQYQEIPEWHEILHAL